MNSNGYPNTCQYHFHEILSAPTDKGDSAVPSAPLFLSILEYMCLLKRSGSGTTPSRPVLNAAATTFSARSFEFAAVLILGCTLPRSFPVRHQTDSVLKWCLLALSHKRCASDRELIHASKGMVNTQNKFFVEEEKVRGDGVSCGLIPWDKSETYDDASVSARSGKEWCLYVNGTKTWLL